jgi:hypothetical protein
MSVQNQYNNTSSKPPVCWAADTTARSLRIEVSPERSLLLPFDGFRFTECLSQDDEQQLRLVFTSHEVLIRGKALRRIETAIQRMELSLLCKISATAQTFIPEGQPVVLEIEVTDLERPVENQATLVG